LTLAGRKESLKSGKDELKQIIEKYDKSPLFVSSILTRALETALLMIKGAGMTNQTTKIVICPMLTEFFVYANKTKASQNTEIHDTVAKQINYVKKLSETKNINIVKSGASRNPFEVYTKKDFEEWLSEHYEKGRPVIAFTHSNLLHEWFGISAYNNSIWKTHFNGKTFENAKPTRKFKGYSFHGLDSELNYCTSCKT
jgi:broad specificity phosphatase PhoE